MRFTRCASVALAGAVAAGVVAVVPGSASAGTSTSSPAPPPPRPTVAAVHLRASTLPLPVRSGSGRRVVYSEKLPQHVWLVEADGRIVRDMAASGRADWPRPGTYHVFSQSPSTTAPGLTFRWMTRFAHGRKANIGFHTIPKYAGTNRYTHPVSQLGLNVGHGGCVHLTDADAKFLYRWVGLGTTVIVLR